MTQARVLFTLLVAPHFAMPLLTWRGSLNTLYLDGATLLMRWSLLMQFSLLMQSSRLLPASRLKWKLP